MQKRRVTAPDGTKWIVGRRWLLHRPSYFGFRFGVDKREPTFEAPAGPLGVERKPGPTKAPTPPVVRYKSQDKKPRKRRRGSSGGGGWIFTGGGRGSGGRSSGGGLFSGSSGGGSRGSSGGGRRGSSGGGKRGGGGGAGGAAGAALTALAQFLKYIAIIAVVIAAALFIVFVGIPVLVFLIQYLAFWVVVGVSLLYRVLSGRPWIVEMEEADGYRVRSWRVVGWEVSKAAIADIAEDIRNGREPQAEGAEPVEILNAVE